MKSAGNINCQSCQRILHIYATRQYNYRMNKKTDCKSTLGFHSKQRNTLFHTKHLQLLLYVWGDLSLSKI